MTRNVRYVGPSLLVLAGVVLALAWDRVPQHWISHWGPGGRPDGFSAKSALAACMPLLIAPIPLTLFEAIASVLERRGPVAELSRASASILRLVSAGVAAVFAMFTVALPLLHPQRPQRLAAAALLLILCPLAIGLVHYARTMRELKRTARAELEGYHGIFYSNPSDDRLWVPKLEGFGYTLNFARREAWWIMALLLLPAVIATCFLIGALP